VTRSKLIALVLGVMAVVYAVTVTGTSRSTSTSTSTSGLSDASRRTSAATALAGAPAPHVSTPASPAGTPASLDGTEPDGDLTVTVSRGTIRLFDYYLTTIGETDRAGVRALVAAEADRQSPDNTTEVLALFDRYTAYLDALHEVHASTIDDYFAQTLALQDRHFGPDAETLFGEDNASAARLLASYATR
jgi:hypothetical protein